MYTLFRILTDFCSIKLLKWNINWSLSEKEYKIFNIGPNKFSARVKVYFAQIPKTADTSCCLRGYMG